MTIHEDHDEALSFSHNVVCPACGFVAKVFFRLDFSQPDQVSLSATCDGCGDRMEGSAELTPKEG